MASLRRTVTLTLAFVVCVLVAAGVAATSAVAVGESLAATAAQDSFAVEASLALDRSTRRLIQQGLRNEGFDAGTPDGLFGPRTRAAIRDWQQSRGASPSGYLTGPEAELLRTAAAAASAAPPPPQAVAAVDPSASSAAAAPASTSAETDPSPASPPNVTAEEVDPQNAGETNTQQRTRAGGGDGTVQLPPEILVDRHLVRAERLLADADPAAALEAMNEILALQEKHDLVLGADFGFQYAQIAFGAGQTGTAIAALNEYLVTAGRGGAFYREALELLDSAEVRLLREEEDRRRAEARFRDCEACPEMVPLPGGNLALGRYEVTVGEYRAFAAATGGGAGRGCHGLGDGSSWRNPGLRQTDRHPVTCVSLEDAQAYLSWLSHTSGEAYRLPTWAELVRGSEGSQPGCYKDRTGRDGTCPVGTYGSNALGLSDMLGNVEEWASDCWEGDCGRRVTHGGGWATPPRHLVRNRYGGGSSRPYDRYGAVGFRVARTLD